MRRVAITEGRIKRELIYLRPTLPTHKRIELQVNSLWLRGPPLRSWPVCALWSRVQKKRLPDLSLSHFYISRFFSSRSFLLLPVFPQQLILDIVPIPSFLRRIMEGVQSQQVIRREAIGPYKSQACLLHHPAGGEVVLVGCG